MRVDLDGFEATGLGDGLVEGAHCQPEGARFGGQGEGPSESGGLWPQNPY